MVALALVVTAAAAGISLLLSWYYRPYLATRNGALDLTEMSPFGLGVFDLRGVSFAAWTLAAFALAECFSRHGYTQLTSYQPASRFWAFQGIEGAWLLAVAVLLIAATALVVHRRAV